VPVATEPAERLDELVWSDLCELLSHPGLPRRWRGRGGQWPPQELELHSTLMRLNCGFTAWKPCLMSSAGDSLEAHTWSEFLSAVRRAKQELNNPQLLWYRGHAKHVYLLLPSLLRNRAWPDKERVLFEEYERSAAHIVGPTSNAWEMLEDMQHYGIPTRLLDWTDVLGVAVAFALYDADDSDASAIYVLDPVKLNDKSGVAGVKSVVPNSSREGSSYHFDYTEVYWEGRPFSPIYPIAIQGRLHNERLRAQSGTFTVQGTNAAALEAQVSDVLRKIVLHPAAKPEAREFLEYANLNAFRIYPDIVGMAQHIIRKYLK
jgi:FRG domain-containing protein